MDVKRLLSTADDSRRTEAVSRTQEEVVVEACDGQGSRESVTELAQDYGADAPLHLGVGEVAAEAPGPDAYISLPMTLYSGRWEHQTRVPHLCQVIDWRWIRTY